MVKTAVDRMKDLVDCLPVRDRAFANKFITERRFQDLYDIIKSDIVKFERLSEEERLNRTDVNIDKMNDFLAEVISYLDIIGWDDEIIDDYEEES